MHRSHALTVAAAFALVAAAVPAQTPAPKEPLVVEASAATETAAIEQALLEAIRRTVGVVEDSRTATRHLALVNASVHTLFAASDSSTDAVARIASATKGVVRSYEVLGREGDGDLVRVRVACDVATFDKHRLRDEPLTVVLPAFKTKPGSYEKEHDGARKAEALDLAPLAAQLRDLVERHLVQSKVFQVLDRTDVAATDAELARIEQGQCPPAELMRLHQRLSADYLLQAEIVAATARLETRSLSVPGWSGRIGHEFALRYALLEVPTGRIVRSGTIESAHWPEQRIAIDSNELDLERVFADLASRTAPHLVDAFLGDVDPVLVARVKDDGGKKLATLTQGGGRFALGDLFEIVAVGEPVTHPVTGAVLARDETIVGELRIVDASGTLAIGEVTAGDDRVARGAMVRRRPAPGVRVR